MWKHLAAIFPATAHLATQVRHPPPCIFIELSTECDVCIDCDVYLWFASIQMESNLDSWKAMSEEIKAAAAAKAEATASA